MKELKTAALILCSTILISGCQPRKNMGNKNNNFDLPVNPEIFKTVYDSDYKEMTIEVVILI